MRSLYQHCLEVRSVFWSYIPSLSPLFFQDPSPRPLSDTLSKAVPSPTPFPRTAFRHIPKVSPGLWSRRRLPRPLTSPKATPKRPRALLKPCERASGTYRQRAWKGTCGPAMARGVHPLSFPPSVCLTLLSSLTKREREKARTGEEGRPKQGFRASIPLEKQSERGGERERER